MGGIHNSSGQVAAGGIVTSSGVVSVGDEITDYALYTDLPDGTASAYATLNRLGVWRDPNCVGTVKPWVPIEMQDWTLHSSLHADSYTAGSPPSDWTEYIDAPGTITVHDGVIDVDSGSSGASYVYLRWNTGSAWTTGHDIRAIVRVAQTIEGTPGWFALRLQDYRTGLHARLGVVPSKSGSLRLENNLTGAAKGVAGADAGTATKTWVIEHNGNTSSDLSIAWSLEDINHRAHCPGSDVAESSWLSYSGLEINAAYSGSAAASWAVEWIAIYSKAR